MTGTTHVVVIGDGMVSHRFVEKLCRKDDVNNPFVVTVIGEEPHAAYDRVGLSRLFEGAHIESLRLPIDPTLVGVSYRRGVRATSIDRDGCIVSLSDGAAIEYDRLVLATGSYAFVPPIGGSDARGCFVYRTIDDCRAITAAAASATRGVVIGGGLLGLEAANALALLGLQTEVLEFSDRLLAVQLDDAGARMLRTSVEARGLNVRTGAKVVEVLRNDAGLAAGVRLDDGAAIDADIVVFAAGVRPRDELARASDLCIGERGGVVVDEHCMTSDPRIAAIGEVASRNGRTYGLVAPGYAMAEVLAEFWRAGSTDGFHDADLSTKLKLAGVHVASIGSIHAIPNDAHDVTIADSLTSTYHRVVLSPDRSSLIAAVLVGDTARYGELLAVHRGQRPMPNDPRELLLASASSHGSGTNPIICSCNGVSRSTIAAAVSEGIVTIPELKACTRAGTSCGSCVPLLDTILSEEEQRQTGVRSKRALCEHFDYTRPELYDIVAVQGFTSFRELVAAVGTGTGCEICKPVVASILASRANGHILDGEQASLQDSNDHFLANLQRNGSYSVVPRIPGGEITPTQLIAIGEVARDFDLYTKVTGGQRIDLFGARVDDLPAIWSRLVAHGFESGHAYGKALRTVKSCVGTTWCRYGMQDSVGFAVRVELRYRGLRAPHKIKMAVSGCARECAEAQSKDIGLIATETGYNLYVCGNGGMKPQHAHLLATDLTEDDALRLIDRVLMLYVRTAERLERTATWFNRRFVAEFGSESALGELRRIVVDDRLGLNAALEADMARHVDSYACEWAETLADPQRLLRFVSFVNADVRTTDLPKLAYNRVRGQRQPVALGQTRR